MQKIVCVFVAFSALAGCKGSFAVKAGPDRVATWDADPTLVLREKIVNLQRQNDDFAKAIKESDGRIAALEKDKGGLRTELSDARIALAQEKTKREERDRRITELLEDNNRLRVEKRDTEDRADRATEARVAAEQKVRDMANELDASRAHVQEVDRKVWEAAQRSDGPHADLVNPRAPAMAVANPVAPEPSMAAAAPDAP
jgi:chromosome segregation ATPase